MYCIGEKFFYRYFKDSYLVGLDASMVSYAFIYIHSLRKRAVNTLASVRMCTHSHGPSLLETALSIISDVLAHTSKAAHNA